MADDSLAILAGFGAGSDSELTPGNDRYGFIQNERQHFKWNQKSPDKLITFKKI